MNMTARFGALLVMMMVMAAPAFAADLDGRWAGMMSTPGGDFQVAFVFKADGDKLTGTMIGMDGTPIPIANGTITGDKIAYHVTIDAGGMVFEISFTGVAAATEIRLEASVFDMPIPLVVRKVDPDK
jgi:hypothetical protein